MSGERLLTAAELGLCARDYLAHLGAFKRDAFGNVWADSLRRCPSGLLRLEHDHRSTVTTVVRSSPIAGNEARQLRDTRDNRLSQLFLRTLDVADRDFHEYCVQRAPPIRRQGSSSLSSAALPHKRRRLLEDGVGRLVDQTSELANVVIGDGDAGEVHAERLLRLAFDPNVEVHALAVDDGLAVADLALLDDPLVEHDGTLERNLARELDSHRSVREVETRVVSSGDHGPLPGVRRG